MGKLENEVSNAIFDILKPLKFTVWRQNNHAVPIIVYPNGKPVFKGFKKRDAHFMAGIGDISGILPDGKRLEIEAKKPGGTQSKDQIEFQTIIENSNGIYIVADNYMTVLNELKKLGYLEKGAYGWKKTTPK